MEMYDIFEWFLNRLIPISFKNRRIHTGSNKNQIGSFTFHWIHYYCYCCHYRLLNYGTSVHWVCLIHFVVEVVRDAANVYFIRFNVRNSSFCHHQFHFVSFSFSVGFFFSSCCSVKYTISTQFQKRNYTLKSFTAGKVLVQWIQQFTKSIYMHLSVCSFACLVYMYSKHALFPHQLFVYRFLLSFLNSNIHFVIKVFDSLQKCCELVWNAIKTV